MKKILALTLVMALFAGGLAGCGNNTSQSSQDQSGTLQSSAASVPEENTGTVYYLNFKPEQDEAWKDLADQYAAATGVEVEILTAASGTYEQNLMSEMAKTNPPTLFQVNGINGLANWRDYCYDLSGTDFYAELQDDAFALKEGEEVLAVAFTVESYGLITNTTLLAQAGYTTDDIRSFADLKAVAEDITAREEALGFSAFTSAGMDPSSDWRFKTHLANMPIYFEYQDADVNRSETIQGTYLDNFKNLWDLYINNATCAPEELAGKTGDDARNEFLAGEAVFFQNGSWEYGNLIGDGKFSEEELQMIPIYTGVGDEAGQGLCTGTENYWCVNKEASQENIQATLDFMYWCVNSEAGTEAMANDMGFTIPFENGLESANLFIRQADEMAEAGRTPVAWSFTSIPTEEWKNGVGSALTAYAAGTGDWEAVRTAFVDGWAEEYAALNG